MSSFSFPYLTLAMAEKIVLIADCTCTSIKCTMVDLCFSQAQNCTSSFKNKIAVKRWGSWTQQMMTCTNCTAAATTQIIAFMACLWSLSCEIKTLHTHIHTMQSFNDRPEAVGPSINKGTNALTKTDTMRMERDRERETKTIRTMRGWWWSETEHKTEIWDRNIETCFVFILTLRNYKWLNEVSGASAFFFSSTSYFIYGALWIF